MMFLDLGPDTGDVLAISQPAHAWVSGQLLRHWATALDESLLFATEQHDLAWLDWELAPSFDPATQRPALFRAVGAAVHAPLWAAAVDRALAAWGMHVALLVSRHGSVIYTRFTDRHRLSDADADAAGRYLREQALRQQAWAGALGFAEAQLEQESGLVAFADALSLALCGALAAPLELTGPAGRGYRLERDTAGLTLAPWPFRNRAFAATVEGRVIPGGRLADAGAMQHWLGAAAHRRVELRLHAG